MFNSRSRKRAFMAAGLTLPLFLAACSGGGSNDGSSEPGAEKPAGEQVTLTMLADNAENQVLMTEAVIADFEAKNPDIKINFETRPGGGDGDNIVKTRLATGEMTDLFQYNSGSLFQQINPSEYVLPITGEPFLDAVNESFFPTVSVGDEIFGVPHAATLMAGGVMYSTSIYEELGLEIPLTWDDFIANSEKVKESGKTGIIQTYADTWTSQLFVLGDFHNVLANDPDFPDNYTANKINFSDSPYAIRGFEHLQEAFEKELLNRDFAAATYDQGLLMLANGEGAHYPILTFAIGALTEEQLENVGFFALPGDDAAKNGMTSWMPDGLYISKDTKHPDEAKRFLEYMTTVESCSTRDQAIGSAGPYLIDGCELPDSAPKAAKDMATYVDAGTLSPALEFLSPVKGPSLEQITVEVGSGIATAVDGAKRYDEDVKKQAQQLGLEGW
ncbi:extracellular solute-binding protein [Jonesiaceae bacterium BS-20]|uniref:Extracellular solute-binding protein n=1 Tax=Jonesiaceae bacterium BS-20 TaxID=3120821 RepID=A0AAU7DT98_9MICO